MKNKIKEEILGSVKNDLERIEQELVNNLNPHVDMVSGIAGYLLFSGGKRIRPLMLVLCARLCNYKGDYDYTFSTVFEYLHAATLLHDDIIDGAQMRRGKPTAHTLWGLPETILTGDFLLARSLSIATDTNLIPIIRLAADVTSVMSQGEIFQMVNQRNLDMDETMYMEVIRGKTAALMEASCQSGAILAGADEQYINALADYGYNIGMAFQIADDLLDYTAETKILGKNIGSDLREGRITLPLIHCLKNASKDDHEIMKSVILNESFSYIEFEQLTSILKKYQSIDYAYKKAVEFSEQAKTSLNIFAQSPTKEVLLKLANYVITRDN